MTNQTRTTCLICGATLVSHLDLTKRRRVRSDKLTCGPTCRKRRSRRRAAARELQRDLPGQMRLLDA
jgi:hypothetical protein